MTVNDRDWSVDSDENVRSQSWSVRSYSPNENKVQNVAERLIKRSKKNAPKDVMSNYYSEPVDYRWGLVPMDPDYYLPGHNHHNTKRSQ